MTTLTTLTTLDLDGVGPAEAYALGFDAMDALDLRCLTEAIRLAEDRRPRD